MLFDFIFGYVFDVFDFVLKLWSIMIEKMFYSVDIYLKWEFFCELLNNILFMVCKYCKG